MIIARSEFPDFLRCSLRRHNVARVLTRLSTAVRCSIGVRELNRAACAHLASWILVLCLHGLRARGSDATTHGANTARWLGGGFWPWRGVAPPRSSTRCVTPRPTRACGGRGEPCVGSRRNLAGLMGARGSTGCADRGHRAGPSEGFTRAYESLAFTGHPQTRRTVDSCAARSAPPGVRPRGNTPNTSEGSRPVAPLAIQVRNRASIAGSVKRWRAALNACRSATDSVANSFRSTARRASRYCSSARLGGQIDDRPVADPRPRQSAACARRRAAHPPLTRGGFAHNGLEARAFSLAHAVSKRLRGQY
jgi:hypothetical protein